MHRRSASALISFFVVSRERDDVDGGGRDQRHALGIVHTHRTVTTRLVSLISFSFLSKTRQFLLCIGVGFAMVQTRQASPHDCTVWSSHAESMIGTTLMPFWDENWVAINACCVDADRMMMVYDMQSPDSMARTFYYLFIGKFVGVSMACKWCDNTDSITISTFTVCQHVFALCHRIDQSENLLISCRNLAIISKCFIYYYWKNVNDFDIFGMQRSDTVCETINHHVILSHIFISILKCWYSTLSAPKCTYAAPLICNGALTWMALNSTATPSSSVNHGVMKVQFLMNLYDFHLFFYLQNHLCENGIASDSDTFSHKCR